MSLPEYDDIYNNIPDDEFIIYLTIDGTSYEKIGVKVTDPNKTIYDQIHSIISVFNLPLKDNGGNRIHYLLGHIMKDGGEPVVLEFENADGQEQTLIDCNVQPGDHLHLISAPLCGGGVPVFNIKISNNLITVNDIIHLIISDWGLQYLKDTNTGDFFIRCGKHKRLLRLLIDGYIRLEEITGRDMNKQLKDFAYNKDNELLVTIYHDWNNVTMADRLRTFIYKLKKRRYINELNAAKRSSYSYKWISTLAPQILKF